MSIVYTLTAETALRLAQQGQDSIRTRTVATTAAECWPEAWRDLMRTCDITCNGFPQALQLDLGEYDHILTDDEVVVEVRSAVEKRNDQADEAARAVLAAPTSAWWAITYDGYITDREFPDIGCTHYGRRCYTLVPGATAELLAAVAARRKAAHSSPEIQAARAEVVARKARQEAAVQREKEEKAAAAERLAQVRREWLLARCPDLTQAVELEVLSPDGVVAEIVDLLIPEVAGAVKFPWNPVRASDAIINHSEEVVSAAVPRSFAVSVAAIKGALQDLEGYDLVGWDPEKILVEGGPCCIFAGLVRTVWFELLHHETEIKLELRFRFA